MHWSYFQIQEFHWKLMDLPLLEHFYELLDDIIVIHGFYVTV